MEMCVLHLGSRLSAIPKECVREVFIRPHLSSLPLSPSCLAGLVKFRGDVIPVVHLDQCLNGEIGDKEHKEEKSGTGARNRVVILQTALGLLGLLVDQVGQLEGDAPAPPSDNTLTGTIEAASGKNLSFIHLDALVQDLKKKLIPPQISTGITS